MLGKLRMSIKDCEDAYDSISKRIFEKKAGIVTSPAVAFMAGSYLYDSKPLEDAVKELVIKHIPGATGDAKLQDPSNSPDADVCKVYVHTDLSLVETRT
jgi:hypothetical protein